MIEDRTSAVNAASLFTSDTTLISIKLSIQGINPLFVNDCDRAFARSYNLRDHQRIHTGERPCKCGHCDKTFRRRRGLREHETNVFRLHSPRNELGTLKEKRFIHVRFVSRRLRGRLRFLPIRKVILLSRDINVQNARKVLRITVYCGIT